MNIFWVIIMGGIQGLTEFFPVSSSAHLTLFPWIFNYSDPGLAFDIALHAGTLVAIVIALWPQWIALLRGAAKKERGSLQMIGFLAVTSIPGAAFGVLLEDQAKTIFRTPLLIALDLVFFGAILWIVDHKGKGNRKQSELKWLDAGLIGLSQALAIIPGVSRSGATVTAGRALGLERETAVRYSFMAALPIILGATVWRLRDVSPATLISPIWILGFSSSLIASVWAMRVLLKYVRSHNFDIFVWWRFGLAALVLILSIIRR